MNENCHLMKIVQRLRLFIYYGLAPFNKLIQILIARLPGTAHRKIGAIRFVGPSAIIKDAVSVLADFESSSPRLCAVLHEHRSINFYYCPWQKRDASYKNAFFAGDETIVWGKTGILAHMVWTAFKLKANLHMPSVSFLDYYDGNPLKRSAASQMSQWLLEHGQPTELVESYSAISDSSR